MSVTYPSFTPTPQASSAQPTFSNPTGTAGVFNVGFPATPNRPSNSANPFSSSSAPVTNNPVFAPSTPAKSPAARTQPPSTPLPATATASTTSTTYLNPPPSSGGGGYTPRPPVVVPPTKDVIYESEFIARNLDGSLHKRSTYYYLIMNQLSVYYSFVGICLIIAMGVVYDNTSDLRDALSHSLQYECNDLINSLTIYFVLIVLTTLFAVLTVLCWAFRRRTGVFGLIFSVMMLMTLGVMAIFNVVASVYVGKPDAQQCNNDGGQGTIIYNMILADNIIMWISVGSPVLALLLWLAISQWRMLFALFDSESLPSRIREKERELLIKPRQYRHS